MNTTDGDCEMVRFTAWLNNAGNLVTAVLLSGLLAGMVGFLAPSF